MTESLKLNLDFSQVPKNLKVYFYISWIFAVIASTVSFIVLLQTIYVYKPKIKSKAQEVIVDISVTNFTKKDFTKRSDKKDEKVMAAKPKKQSIQDLVKDETVVKKTKTTKVSKTVRSLFQEVNITAQTADIDDILDEPTSSEKAIKVKSTMKKASKKQVKVIAAAKPSKQLELKNVNDKIRLANVKTDEFKVTEPTNISSTRVYKHSQELNISNNVVESEGIENAYIDGIRNFISNRVQFSANDANSYVRFKVYINKSGQFRYQILNVQGSEDFNSRVRYQIEVLQKKGLPKPKRFLEIEVNIYGKKDNR